MLATIDMPFSALPDSRLAGLYSATVLWHDPAPALAVCVGQACMLEAKRRQHNREVATSQDDAIAAELLQFDFSHWSDGDLGDALLLLAAFSKSASSADFGEIVDSLLDTVAMVVVARLRDSGDPRNAVPFVQRLKGVSSANDTN